ncbi:unnamed protein product [Auanema sp. JU1783]|nr:unnamed protein product [Auanema sp. JU1783]
MPRASSENFYENDMLPNEIPEEEPSLEIPLSEDHSDTPGESPKHPPHLDRWWMPERIRKTVQSMKARRMMPRIRGTQKLLHIPKVNKNVLMILCIVMISTLPTTMASSCENAVLFSKRIIANPQCNVNLAFLSISLPILFILAALACICRLNKGQRINQMWTNQLRTQFDNMRSKLTRKDETSHDNHIEMEIIDAESEEQKERQVEDEQSYSALRIPSYMRMGSRLSLLAIIISVSITVTNCCQNAHIRRTTDLICYNRTNCVKEYAQEFVFSSRAREACIEFLHKNVSIGSVEITRLHTIHTCVPTFKYYTRNTKMKVSSHHRCSSMGSCNDSCGTTAATVRFHELEPYTSAFQTGCQRSCGFLFCGCLTYGDSCILYKLEHIPITELIYKVIQCNSWTTEITLKIKTTLFKKSETLAITMSPYETYKHPLFNLTIISHTRTPVYGLQKAYALSANSSYLVEEQSIMMHCTTEREATNNLVNCSTSRHCDCSVNQRGEASCNCPHHEFATPSRKLPLNQVEGSIKEINGQIIIDSTLDESKVALESSMTLESHTFTYEFPCHLQFINITGCYSCDKGAKLRITCISEKDTWITLQCQQATIMIECAPWEPLNEVIYAAIQASPSDTCTTVCADQVKQVKITGNLYWEPEEETPQYDRSTKQGGDSFDVMPLVLTMSSNWQRVVLIVIALIAITILIYMFASATALQLLKIATKLAISSITAGKRLVNVLNSFLKEPAEQLPE